MSASGICCYGISLKTGSRTVAAILMALDVIGFGMLTVSLIHRSSLISNPSELYELSSTTIPPSTDLNNYRTMKDIAIVLGMLLLFLDFGMNILLWTGVSEADHRQCKIWRIWTIFLMVLAGGGAIVGICLHTFTVFNGIFAVLEFLFDVYAVTLVSLLITDIQDYPSEYLHPLNPV